MLAFGDLAWVPFIYSSQAIFLTNAAFQASASAIPIWFLAVLIALFGIEMSIKH